MTTITLTCTGASVQADVCGELTSGMTGIVVNIDFDAAWEGLTPTFYAGNTTDKAVPMAIDAGGLTKIPPEVMISGKELLIGARGVNAAGDIILPTRWACVGMIDSSPDDAEEVTPKPPVTPDIVDQIKAQAYSASVNAAESKEAAESAQLSAGESAASAAESAEAANRAAGEASGAKQAANEATQKAATAEGKADTALSIASGASRAFTAETFQELQAWLRDPANAGKLMRGDNLYIVALDTPDYWVVSPLPSADPETGYYYRISPLETSKVDLSGYAKLSQLSSVATSGDYNDLKNKPTIPADQSKKIEDLEKTSSELKEGYTQLDNTKVGYSEVVNGQLLMYSDDTKAHLLATLDLPSGGVTDVMVQNASIVSDGVARLKLFAGFGYDVNGLYIGNPSDKNIDDRASNIALTCQKMAYAVKSALTVEKQLDTVWTPEEQAAARTKLGIPGGWELKGTITEGSPAATVDMTGCTEVYMSGRVSATVATIHIFCKLPGYNNANWANNISANGERFFALRHVDTVDGIAVIAGKTGTTNRQLVTTINAGYSRIDGLHIADITDFHLSTVDGLTSAEIKIYAR